MKRKAGFKSVKGRQVFWLLMVALLPLFIVSVIISYQRIVSIKEREFSKLIAIRDFKVEQVTQWLDERFGDLKTISEDYEIRGLEISTERKSPKEAHVVAVHENARKLLERYLQNYDDYYEIFVLNPNSGRIEVSTHKGSEGEDRSKDPYFTVPMKTKQIYIKNIYYSKTAEEPSMAFSIPIFSLARSGKQIAGILVARVNLNRSLFALLFNRTGMGTTGETLIVDKDVTALNELRWHDNAPLRLKIAAEPAVLAAQGKSGITESKDYRGVEVLAAYAHIPITGWGFVAKQDLKEVYAPIRTMLWQIGILFVLAAVIVYGLAFYLARKIARPVRQMTEVARKIEKGNLSARNTVESADELGFLAKSFNNMADVLMSQMEIQKAGAEITETMVAAGGIGNFRKEILKKLMKVTASNLGACHVLNRENGQFEHFTSVGINPELLDPFDGSFLEGEFGEVLTTKRITHTKDIPANTHFGFKTFVGTIVPKEIITIPLVMEGMVVLVISLANINRYSNESLEILHRVWGGMNTGVSNLLANEEIKKLAKELTNKNQELQGQTEELQAQSEELQAQSEELRETSDELRQRSEELQGKNTELETKGNQVEEANRLKSEFLSNMSHELRTPLNSVMALSRVLIMQAKEKLSEEEVNYLEIIERNGKQLLALINDILDLSRIEAGKMDISPKVFPLKSTIEVIMESLAPLAEEKGIEITQQIPEDLPRIESDESRVHQILQNIIGNGVKFTNKGGVAVSASSDTEKVYVRVKDTGIGISSKDLPNIFDEFRQVDGSSSRMYEGTGLGLAIAYKAAKMVGGDISVESTPGKGSAFNVTLPIKWGGITEIREPVIAGSPTETMGEGQKTVLIVEDNESSVIQVKSILESGGFMVDVARDGEKALDYIKQRIPDGIILDLMMPGVDGFEVLEELRSTKDTAGIPVLILTAKDLTPDDLNRLSANNIQQLIQKGDVNREDLLDMTRKMSGLVPEMTTEVAHKKNKTNPPAARKEVMLPNRKRKGKSTILVIEDNPENLITIKAVLKSRYEIFGASDGETGLKTTLVEQPDLVLLDMSLPKMDGFEVARNIKKDENTRHIPVIALTARAMKGDREKTIEAGCDDYISKPIDPEEILTKIQKWAGKS